MSSRQRGELTALFLERIVASGGDLVDHLVGFLEAGYGASLRKIEYLAHRHRQRRLLGAVRNREERILRNRYFLMLHRLKRDGLIKEKIQGDRRIISMTIRGRFKLKRLKKSLSKECAIPDYRLSKGNHLVIVIFDIPERIRWKRAWLRAVLENLGFNMVQKSVWIGKGVLPPEFLIDLKKMRLVGYIEIFEVTKSGTLGQSHIT